jgi:hypothetical protein
MAVQSLLFDKARWSYAQTYPQKMGAEFFHARVGILQLIEIPSLFIFSMGSHGWATEWKRFSCAIWDKPTLPESRLDWESDGVQQPCRERETEYGDLLVADTAGISGCGTGT